MNAGIFRLVYNQFRGLWMVVSECAKSHQRSSKSKRARQAKSVCQALLVLVINGTSASLFAAPLAPNTIPTGLVVKNGNININAPVVNPANSNGQLLKIDQSSLKGILQGGNFDIGSASAVNFNHTGGAGSATLVRITGPQTTIEGALNSPNGQIYLINQNGILFGNGASVNVNGLVASALNIQDSDFLNDLGHLYPYTNNGRAAYTWEGDAAGFTSSLVQLAPNAQINAALGSSVMLFAPRVINEGSITTTSGQVVMAAGAKVYLSFAPDLNYYGSDASPDIRGKVAPTSASYAKDSPYRALAGVLVEVDPYQVNGTVTHGSVENAVTGSVLAQRGNITMASYLINQNGRATATTSVVEKGSIRLLARDLKGSDTAAVGVGLDGRPVSNSNTMLGAGTQSGVLNFGVGSQTTILPQHDTATISDSQVFNPSTLEAVGKTISVLDNASIVVPGGYISLSAQAAGDQQANTNTAGVGLTFGQNTLIDASGLKNVAVSMDRNFVEVLLTTNDLQDDPLNKAGFLYHKNVWFDIRHLPDARVANLAGYIPQVGRSIEEKLTTAGAVSLRSEGGFVQQAGSVVDVSGGSIQYAAGTHKETWLKDINGNAYALSNAPAGLVYSGFLNGSNYRTSYEHGYTEGAAAGALAINGYAMTLAGQIKGGATYGEYQRTSANLGGSFTLNSLGTNADTADILITNTATNALATTILLDANVINQSGFESFNLHTTGNISNTTALNLAQGSKLTLNGQAVNIGSDIVARGGSITLLGTSVNVGNGVKLDVSGNWTNDYINPASATGRVLSKGGSVTLTSLGSVALGTGSLVDVSGGGWLSGAGKLSNGDAGSITIAANVMTNANGAVVGGVSSPTELAPVLGGELRGYALGVGGSLSVTAPFVTIGASGIGDSRELWLTPSFFQNGGFTSYSLTGRDGVLVKSGAQVDVIAKNYLLNRQYVLAATGRHVADFASVSLLPDYQRSSTRLSLSSQALDQSVIFSTVPAFANSGISAGSVVVQTGARLQVDAHGNRTDSSGNLIAPAITLSAWDRPSTDYLSNGALVYVDGILKASGGAINLTMNGDPTLTTDNDFNASQAIWLGSHAQLVAAGYGQLVPNSTGLRSGTVYDGGTITLNAKKGFIVAEAGSVIDVSGGSATLDILNRPTVIASNGGTVNLQAREGMLLDASFKASSLSALGGQLNVDLGRGAVTGLGLVSAQNDAHYPGYSALDTNNHDNVLPNQKWVLDLSQTAGSGFTAGLVSGNALPTSQFGLAKVSADSINVAGFSRATLKAADVIRFENNVTLNLSNSLRLDAPTIDGSAAASVNLNAPNVMLTNARLSDADIVVRPNYLATTPLLGSATLNVNAQLLDIRGQLSLSGFSQSNLSSAGDIRLTGYSESSSQLPVGALRTTGLLNMTARQIYPTTLSDFTISLEDGLGAVGGNVVFNGMGSHDTVLSAGGKLTVNAQTIDQNGVLLAPFGTIALNGTNLNLNAGSLTSVSANGATIPFGYTSRDALDYLYNYGIGASTVLTPITAPPERVVKLNGTNVNVKAGSTVDVSAGGDLYAYEWVPGVGGSTDVLANGAKQSLFSIPGGNASNTWAIMPAGQTKYSSFDTQYWNGSNIQAGDAVYLSAMPGLAAGFYTLLPARYALLPGAFLVSAVSGHQDMPAGKAMIQNDGSALVSGYMAANTGAGYVSTSRIGGFVVRAGSDAHKLAEYTDNLSSKRFAGNSDVMQTFDAGRFSISADTSMLLDGVLKAIHAQTARGAEVDIAAPNLLVVNHGDATGSVSLNGTNYLAIDENTLTNMNASSLLLGGTRNNGVINMVASEVRMGANANLSGPEVMLAAKNKVQVDGLATLTGTGTSASARNLTIGRNADTGVAAVDGDGALLRVSGGNSVNITRNNIDLTLANNHGDLLIDAGASVQGLGAVQLDATRNMSVLGLLSVGNGSIGTGALTVAAGRVSLGNGSPTDGLGLTQAQLDAIGGAASLSLTSYSTIDLYGNVNVGNDKLNLTMQAAGISGYQLLGQSGQTASIIANQFSLNNAENRSAAAVLASNNNLNVLATNIVTGANTLNLSGFNEVKLNALQNMTAQGSGSLIADKALTISAGRVTAQTAAEYKLIAANGVLTVQGLPGSSLPTAASQSQAAKLNLQGNSVVLGNGANIDASGAQISVQALGLNATDGISMSSGATIQAQGSLVTIKDQSIVLPAGKVMLSSLNGDVNLQTGSKVDVSAASSGDAGAFKATAVNGAVTLGGTLVGGNNAVASVDAKTLDINQALQALNLDAATGFAGAQSYRMRTGDALISTDVKTQNLSLTADNGAMAVNSQIDASGAKGGTIELYAKNDLTLNANAKLLAKGTADKLTTAGTQGNGGNVTLSSDSGLISANPNALIDVSGDQVGSVQGVGGNVIMRAARSGDFATTGAYDPNTYTGGVKVDNNATGVIKGASKILVEALGVYDASSTQVIDSSLIQTVVNDTTVFADYVTANSTGAAPFAFKPASDGVIVSVMPGIEIRSSGDLSLTNDWALGSTGGVLTLRAAGSLNVSKNISYEQLSNPTPVAAWSYRLIGNADLSSANSMAVTPSANPSSVTIAAGKYIRTGGGFIDVQAGGDIALGSGAAIYTEGIPDLTLKTDFAKLLNNFKEFYPSTGGDVRLNALGSITGAANSTQTANSWLFRAVKSNPTAFVNVSNPNLRWWSYFNAFNNGIGALGGGDVTVTAGGDISGLQFASATNGRMGGLANSIPTLTNLTVNGGGDVGITANGNISNTLIAVGKGEGSANSGQSASVKFELMDASAKVYAGGNAAVTGVANSTVIPLSTALKFYATSADASTSPLNTYFYSYGQQSAVSAISAAGDVSLTGSSVYPGQVLAAAPHGNVTATGLTLYPSSSGNAVLLAGNDLTVTGMTMSEVDPLSLPTVLTQPIYNPSGKAVPTLNLYSGSGAHTFGLLHANDSAPALFYAGKDVVFDPLSPVVLPKSLAVYAGHDVIDANLVVQNNLATDVSSIEAGANIRYTDAGVNPEGAIMPNPASLQVAGPGRLQLVAGKDIDLGSSGGVRSVGDLYNPYLTPQGADVMVMPGAGNGPDYTAMINRYLVNDPTMAAIYVPQLVDYMNARNGATSLTASQALDSFKLLDARHQNAFIDSIFYAELKAGGRDAINAKSTSLGDYTRSERAILTMFPSFTSNTALVNKTGSLMAAFKNIGNETIANPGDLKLFYSQIRSEAGGNIELMVPEGYINSGLAVAGNLNKPSTDLGIVSIRGGVIDAFVRNNFQVNQSRVFTLGGSDLMLYSALTNIDAGRGAKTSSATPPPVLRIRNGQITYDYSAAVSGSGIAALTATGGQPGTVDLFAPYGEINAGEAGIRSAGNINLGARVIIGSENISAGGVTSGAPVASVSGLSFTPVSAESANSGKQGNQLSESASKSANNKASALPSLISVEVLALGEEAGSTLEQNSDDKKKVKKQ